MSIFYHFLRRFFPFFLLLLISFHNCFSQDKGSSENCNCPGQHKKGKGTFYGSWGYNRDWFSKSDIHFYNNGSDNYDFTLYDVAAKDRPGFDLILKNLARGDVSVPQYAYRVGYYFNDKYDLGVEINFDHTKYVMVQDQRVHIKGQIHETILDKDTILSPDFLKFEHTNGANFLMGNFLKRARFFHSGNNKHWISTVVKIGAGIMIPKTDITLFNNHLDNKFHIAGWLTGIESGLRYDGFKHFFFESTVKGTYVDYTNVLTIGTGRANHHFWCFEALLTAGFQFGW